MHHLRPLLFLMLACGGRPAEPATPIGLSSPKAATAAKFSFDSLDARPVSSDAMRGKVAVVIFVTTFDVASQAVIDFAIPIAKRDDQVAFAMVALQPRRERELVEGYRDALGVPFPAALSDVQEASAAGFGEVRSVPVTVILDAEGKLVFRKDGLVKGEELRRAIQSARSAPR